MKKIILAFAACLTTMAASAQFSVDTDLGTDSTYVINFNGAPKAQFTEGRIFAIFTDTVRITALEPGHIISSANTLVAVDQYGRLFPVSKTGLMGTYLEATKGSTTFSGITLTTQYTVTHGAGFTPSQVYIQAKSLNASALSYVDNITSTTFRITFLTIPVIGVNNISFNWIAYR